MFLLFLILVLLTLSKINGDVVSKYNGECNDIFMYLESQEKSYNLFDCKMTDKGEVTELQLSLYCIDNE